MQKILLLVSLLLTSLFSAELKHLTIGNQDFAFTRDSYDIYDSKGEVLRLYKEERNYDLKFIFSLILKDRTGVCSDKSVEDGHYEINGTTITLYSHWDRRGKAYNAPYGARIEVYKLLDNHDIVRTSSKVYIETARQNYNDNSGMQYLFKVAKNEKEKQALKAYVDRVERHFKGNFVYGDEAKKLIKEVEDAMTRKMKSIWQ